MADSARRSELNLGKNVTASGENKRTLTRFRPSEYFLDVWLDKNTNALDKDVIISVNKLQQIVHSVKIFNDTDECIDFLSDIKNKTVFMITSDDLIQSILPLIDDFPQLRMIYILSTHPTSFEYSLEKWQKVRGTFTSIDSICTALKHTIHKYETQCASISIIPESSDVNLDELDQSFMYSQMLKEIIIEMKYDKESRNEFIHYCRTQYSDNEVQINVINTFERDYERHSPISSGGSRNF